MLVRQTKATHVLRLQGVPRGVLQLVAVACMMLAAKSEEVVHPSVQELTDIAANCFTVSAPKRAPQAVQHFDPCKRISLNRPATPEHLAHQPASASMPQLAMRSLCAIQATY